jgi:hypothetical protein
MKKPMMKYSVSHEYPRSRAMERKEESENEKQWKLETGKTRITVSLVR